MNPYIQSDLERRCLSENDSSIFSGGPFTSAARAAGSLLSKLAPKGRTMNWATKIWGMSTINKIVNRITSGPDIEGAEERSANSEDADPRSTSDSPLAVDSDIAIGTADSPSIIIYPEWVARVLQNGDLISKRDQIRQFFMGDPAQVDVSELLISRCPAMHMDDDGRISYCPEVTLTPILAGGVFAKIKNAIKKAAPKIANVANKVASVAKLIPGIGGAVSAVASKVANLAAGAGQTESSPNATDAAGLEQQPVARDEDAAPTAVSNPDGNDAGSATLSSYVSAPSSGADDVGIQRIARSPLARLVLPVMSSAAQRLSNASDIVVSGDAGETYLKSDWSPDDLSVFTPSASGYPVPMKPDSVEQVMVDGASAEPVYSDEGAPKTITESLAQALTWTTRDGRNREFASSTQADAAHDELARVMAKEPETLSDAAIVGSSLASSVWSAGAESDMVALMFLPLRVKEMEEIVAALLRSPRSHAYTISQAGVLLAAAYLVWLAYDRTMPADIDKRARLAALDANALTSRSSFKAMPVSKPVAKVFALCSKLIDEAKSSVALQPAVQVIKNTASEYVTVLDRSDSSDPDLYAQSYSIVPMSPSSLASSIDDDFIVSHLSEPADDDDSDESVAAELEDALSDPLSSGKMAKAMSSAISEDKAKKILLAIGLSASAVAALLALRREANRVNAASTQHEGVESKSSQPRTGIAISL